MEELITNIMPITIILIIITVFAKVTSFVVRAIIAGVTILIIFYLIKNNTTILQTLLVSMPL